MKRIASVHLKNFKAFRDQLFDFDGKHILIYGTNGSGKSSLFWALYTFLQSSRKENPDIQRYFQPFKADDDTTFRSLKNVFANEADDAFIKLTWFDTDTGIRTEQCIAKEAARINSNTNGSVIEEADLASDFINYKLLQNFYNVTHRQAINLWDVFIRDVFPFFVEDGKSYLERLNELKLAKGRNAKAKSIAETDGLNEQLQLFLSTVEVNANAFLKDYFHEKKDVLKLHFLPINHIGIYPFIDYEWSKKNSNREPDDNLPAGRIDLWVETFDQASTTWIANYRPHSFLNEAQLTRIAIAVRIGALQTRPTAPDFKILCLDDMLISLDMSNRDKVIKMLLNYDGKGSDYFNDFQKIILTHDKGFYNIIRRYTYPQDWKYYELKRDEKDSSIPPTVTPGLTLLQTATTRFEEGLYEECALALRKEIEELCKWELYDFNEEQAEEKRKDETKKYATLQNMLGEIKNKLCEQERQRFNSLFVNKKIPPEKLHKLDVNFEVDESVSEFDKHHLRAIQKELSQYMIRQYDDAANVTHLFDRVQFVVDFYLNKNAHPETAR
ncbi:MAG: AAA family ATPase [Spirosoma sp.]|nr:AAA family ATPase [Spirosoma sp.]